MREIPLSQGKVALVDDEDFERVSQHTWHFVGAEKLGYARTTIRENGVPHKVRMHRFVMNAGPNTVVDHKNGDGLDNRRENLRFATQSQNCANSRRSKLKGLRYRAATRKWEARISFEHRTIQIGQFPSEILAAFAYDRKARELFGEFACPNFHPDYEGAYADSILDTL